MRNIRISGTFRRVSVSQQNSQRWDLSKDRCFQSLATTTYYRSNPKGNSFQPGGSFCHSHLRLEGLATDVSGADIWTKRTAYR